MGVALVSALLLCCESAAQSPAGSGDVAGAPAASGVAGSSASGLGAAAGLGVGAGAGGGSNGGVTPTGGLPGADTTAGAAASGGAGSPAGGSAGASAGVAGTAGSGGAAGSGGSSNGPELPKASGILCVFDYDLTLSTNNCKTEQFACRTNTCITYNWYQQCMSSGGRPAIEVFVERGAYIGIASHATLDACWDDKVSVIISQQQFPALTSAARYNNSKADFSYPKLDQHDNWNCDTCAYHMNGAFTKPQLISKVMTHYGMDPSKPADRAKVIFWDDLPDNITKTNAAMPEVHAVHVHQNIDGQPNSGGCGILESDVAAGWAAFPQ
jgi:hypothetical protein